MVVFASAIHALLRAPADADSYYHVRHARLYLDGGVLQTAFPWTQDSVVRTYAADLWYGFHVLLLPVAARGDLVGGLYLGAWAVTVLALVLVFLAVSRLGLRWPALWVFAFALASADALYRLTMLRPHPLSLGLIVALFAYLVTETTPRRRLVAIALLTFALAWIHLALVWMAPLVALVVTAVRLAHRHASDWRALASVAAGLLAGWLLRPNPIGAARLARVQVVDLLLVKRARVPLAFGVELAPFGGFNFVDQLVPIAALVTVALGYLVWLIARGRYRSLPSSRQIAVWSSLILCAGFFVLTFTVARRANELFVAFAVLFAGLLAMPAGAGRRAARRPAPALALAALALAIAAGLTLHRFRTYAETTAGVYRPERLKAVSLWLAQHARPGEIVFNVHWGMFPHLFFWSPGTYYINGMDPIFQYAYDPALYWKNHFLAFEDATGVTCGATRCTVGEVAETYAVLKRDFHASYIVVDKGGPAKLYRYLTSDPRFRKLMETDEDALFAIL